ncbi:MAG: tetraacyldisaccharide 4'-kinase [Gemmatimonadota bacterium]|nr:tetraacyldisaccharide 4'-kinase [Gemmatimonadota bacterium]
MKIEDAWYRDAATERAVRAALTPLSWLYGSVVRLRNALYDLSMVSSVSASVPVVSVGNLTVGGTGKTPVTAYLVHELLAMGHRPAVVMRGYGDDEPVLHERLNPWATVYTGANRSQSIARAERDGADVVVMDDAFQHRAAARDLDIVLVSADSWREGLRVLPSGPLREPLTSLERADIVIVTRKSADVVAAASVVEALRRHVRPQTAMVTATIMPVEITAFVRPATKPLQTLRGASVLAIAGVGDPVSFYNQLRALDARVTERRFRDHHAYNEQEAIGLARESAGHKYVITTEKDAIKLASVWPVNAPELWYLSQAVTLAEGSASVGAALAELFVTRATSIVG